MRTVDEALRDVLERIEPLDPERVSLLDAVGRVLAEPVVADRPLPGWDDSAMDGYAVRAADVAAPGATLPVRGEVRAGDAGDVALEPGAAARIFTGAPLPPGADAVVPQEDTEREGDRVRFREATTAGRHVRRHGHDVTPGDVVLEAGRVLGPGDLPLLAALGRPFVRVVRRPVVAIASSGDELIELGAGEPKRGQVIDGNVFGLAAAARAAGALPRVMPFIPDDRAATRRALTAAARADVLITSGGVSVGEYDFVREILVELSGERFAFWKVAMKPGKPLAFGHIGACAAFGLPGNPVSALVTFELFVRPALLRLGGHARVRRCPVPARLDAPLAAGGARRDFRRATVRRADDGELRVAPRRSQSSGALSSIAGADALIDVAPGAPARAAGDEVAVLLLGPDDPATRLPA